MGPGDEVVCVGTEDCCDNGMHYPKPEVGMHYVVRMYSHDGHCTVCGGGFPVLRTVGCPLEYPYAWAAHWFRPLEYDEDRHLADAGVRLPIRVDA